MDKKQILLIGAGAVGIVYGRQLAEAGHDITFLVKEKYREPLSKGVYLYDLNKDKALNNPIKFSRFSLIASFQELSDRHWDQIYLCFSSTALQSFDFVSFRDQLEGEPTIVMLQPGTADYEVVSHAFSPPQIVEGMITLISYAAPLATEQADVPGTAFYFPPFMPTPFAGEEKRRDDVVRTFKQAKIRASSTDSVQQQALFPSAFLGTFLTALEASNWNFKQLAQDKKMLRTLQKALGEVFTGLESRYGQKRPFLMNLLAAPIAIRILLKLAPVVMPMDIETYFEAHFTKVKSQTKMFMQEYIQIARNAGEPTTHIEKLDALT